MRGVFLENVLTLLSCPLRGAFSEDLDRQGRVPTSTARALT